MKVESFQALLSQVPALTEGQLDELVQAVETRRSKTKSLRVLEGAWRCPQVRALRKRPRRQERAQSRASALPVPRLRPDVQRHHGHTVG